MSIHSRLGVTTLPLALLFAAFVGLLGGLASRSTPADRGAAPHAGIATSRGFEEIQPAIHTLDNDSADEEGAWAQLAATIELAKSAQEILSEAESLRAIAGALVEAAHSEPSADRNHKGETDGRSSQEEDQSHRALAEGQLALADKVLRMAQAHAEHARAAFNVAWQNVLRMSPSSPRPDPDSLLRQSGGSSPGSVFHTPKVRHTYFHQLGVK